MCVGLTCSTPGWKLKLTEFLVRIGRPIEQQDAPARIYGVAFSSQRGAWLSTSKMIERGREARPQELVADGGFFMMSTLVQALPFWLQHGPA